jgi:hypothetical protein
MARLLVGILVTASCFGGDGACPGSGCKTTLSSTTNTAAFSGTIASTLSSSMSIKQDTTSADKSLPANVSTQKNSVCDRSIYFSCKVERPAPEIAGSFIVFGSVLGVLCVHMIFPLYSKLFPKKTFDVGHPDESSASMNTHGDFVLSDHNLHQQAAARQPPVADYGDGEAFFESLPGPVYNRQYAAAAPQPYGHYSDAESCDESLPCPVYGSQYPVAQPQPFAYYGDTETRYGLDGNPYPFYGGQPPGAHYGGAEVRYGPDGGSYSVYGAGARFGENQYDDGRTTSDDESDDRGQTQSSPEPGDEGQRYEPASGCDACQAFCSFIVDAVQKASGISVLLASPLPWSVGLYVIEVAALLYSFVNVKYVPGCNLFSDSFTFLSFCGCFGVRCFSVRNCKLKQVSERLAVY